LDSKRLRIVGILTVLVVRSRVVHDVTNALDVHHLPHRLTASDNGYHVIPRLDEISGSRAPESAAASTSTSSASLPDRRLGGTQVDFARRSAAPTTTCAGSSTSATRRRVRAARGAD
jgi:hypothetical protein